MSRGFRTTLAVLTIAAAACAGTSASAAPQETSAPSPPRAAPAAEGERQPPAHMLPPLVLEEPPEPIRRRRARTADEHNRLTAAALYAAGRALMHKGQMPAALRHYQRAWRWDPAAHVILKEIVPLSFSLGRPQEAVRYAILEAEHGDPDPLLLRRLALYVTQTGDWDRAVRLYRLWLDHPEIQRSGDRLRQLLVQLEIGRLEYLLGHADQASQVLGKVQQVLLDRASAASPMGTELTDALADNRNATWELCALAHLGAGALDQAEEALQQIDLSLEAAGATGYQRARVAAARQRPLVAWQHLQEYFAAKRSEEGRQPYDLLGQILASLNQRESLIVELVKLHAQDPDNPALTLALAEELEKQDQVPQAIELYQSVVDSSTNESASLAIAALKRLIALRVEHGNTELLLETLRLAARRLGGLAELKDALESIDAQPGLVDRLVAVAQQDDAGGDSHGKLALAMAQLLLVAERYHDSRPFFAQAVAANKEQAAALTLAWGLELFTAEQYVAAAEMFRQDIDKQPQKDRAAMEHFLAAALEMAGKTDEALQAARRAIDQEPNSAEIAARLPWVLDHAGRRDEAIAAYKDLIEEFDARRDTETRHALRAARFVLSNLLVSSGDLQAGEEWLQQILDEFPQNAGALNDLGYLWADQGKHLQRARAMIETAVAAEPDNAAYRDSLGWVLYRMGDYEAAVRELETAVELSRRPAAGAGTSQLDGPNPEDATAGGDGIMLDHLGDAQLKAGRIDDAISTWHRAVDRLQEQEPDKVSATKAKLAKHARQIDE